MTRIAATSQRNTHNNLRAVLSVIDADDPDSSPLITRAGRPHPRDGRSETSQVLKGAAFATLVDWTRSVAGRPAASSKTPKDSPPSDAATLETTAAPADATTDAADSAHGGPTGNERAVPSPTRRNAPPSAPALGPPPAPTESTALAPRESGFDLAPAAPRPIAGPTRPPDDYKPIDPFDPEIFNRQFAPRGAGERP